MQARIDACTPDDYVDDKRLRHAQEVLDETLVLSVARLERVEDKAKGTMIGVAVAVAILSAAIGVLGPKGVLENTPAMLRLVLAVLFSLGVLFLFVSGHLALRAYKIGRVYRPTLQSQVPLVSVNEHALYTLYCIEQNWRAATLRANLLTASFTCLHNGLAIVMVLGLIVIILAAIAEPAVSDDNLSLLVRHAIWWPGYQIQFA